MYVEMHGAGGGRGAFSGRGVRHRAPVFGGDRDRLQPSAPGARRRAAGVAGRLASPRCSAASKHGCRCATAEAWALDRAALVAISQHTVARFKKANPAFASTRRRGMPPGPARPARPARRRRLPARRRLARADRGADVGGRALQGTRRVAGTLARAARAKAGRAAGRGRRRQRPSAARVARRDRWACRTPSRLSAASGRPNWPRSTNSAVSWCMPSRDEGFGLVFLEAMRAGKACIGARGAAAEIIRHERDRTDRGSGQPRRAVRGRCSGCSTSRQPAAASARPGGSAFCRPLPMSAFRRALRGRSSAARGRHSAS